MSRREKHKISVTEHRKVRTLYGGVVIIFVWYVLHIALNSSIIPSPLETGGAFIRLLQEDLLMHCGVSLYRIAVAVVMATAIGVPLGLWIGRNSRIDGFLSPVVYLLYPIPKIAFLPVFLVLFGLGDQSKIILIITVIVFQMLLSARDGAKEIPKELLDSAKSLGLKKRQIYRHVILPSVLPKILSSLRISIGIAISVLFFAENYATRYGIGYFIMNSWGMVNYVDMFAGIMALSILGILLFWFIDYGQRKLCPWMSFS